MKTWKRGPTKENYGKSQSYNSIHLWLLYHHGRALSCEKCGEKGKQTGRRWSIEHALKPKFKHAKDISHYQSLCKSCHRRQDLDEQMIDNMRKGWVERKSNHGLNKIDHKTGRFIKNYE